MIVSTVNTVQALGGKTWSVMFCHERPAGFISATSASYRTPGLALGWIKRFARSNGGDAAFAIFNDSINTIPSYVIYIGTSSDLKQLASSVRTVSKPVREFFQNL